MLLQAEPVYSNSAEDYTLPPGDTKRDIPVARDAIDDSDDGFNETTNALSERDNRHFCGDLNNIGVYVADANSYSAVSTGFALLLARQYRSTANGRVYPHRFYNNEGIADVYNYCPSGPWFEFPVYASATRVFGSTTNNAGTERVIFDRCGNWCATITHRGETQNRFHACTPA